MTGPEAIVRGLCWLACKPNRPRALFWSGTARAWGQTVPLYSCEQCQRLFIKRALAGVGDELCWLWCGRENVDTELVGTFELAVRTWRTEPARPPRLLSWWECRAAVHGCAMCTEPAQRLIRQGPTVDPPPTPTARTASSPRCSPRRDATRPSPIPLRLETLMAPLLAPQSVRSALILNHHGAVLGSGPPARRAASSGCPAVNPARTTPTGSGWHGP
ncbi:hypothetical protein [Streptomyces sp. Ac-502]|uniref:hypothetical protein n=1 Tax=Streptomyces sp. Ac-502 TaxID=3342801 RepID=UPI003862A036